MRSSKPPLASGSRKASTDALVQSYLEAHRDEIRAVDLDMAAFVAVTSIEALTHTAVRHRADMLSDDTVGSLVDEATRLIVKYLQ